MNKTLEEWVDGRTPEELRAEGIKETERYRQLKAAYEATPEWNEDRREDLLHRQNRAMARSIAFQMLADKVQEEAEEAAMLKARARRWR